MFGHIMTRTIRETVILHITSFPQMVNNLSFVALRVSSPEYSEDTPGYCSANQQLSEPADVMPLFYWSIK
jgi:hypothetical protein